MKLTDTQGWQLVSVLRAEHELRPHQLMELAGLGLVRLAPVDGYHARPLSRRPHQVSREGLEQLRAHSSSNVWRSLMESLHEDALVEYEQRRAVTGWVVERRGVLLTWLQVSDHVDQRAAIARLNAEVRQLGGASPARLVRLTVVGGAVMERTLEGWGPEGWPREDVAL